MVDKENMRDRNAALRTGLGEASQKLLGALSKREIISNIDKSARLGLKKDAIRITPTAATNPLVSSNIQNYTKNILANVRRAEENQKETSQPIKKSSVTAFAKGSLLSTYLSRDKDQRYGSKPKAKREDEPEKRKPLEALHHSKSIMQLHGLSQVMPSLLNPL